MPIIDAEIMKFLLKERKNVEDVKSAAKKRVIFWQRVVEVSKGQCPYAVAMVIEQQKVKDEALGTLRDFDQVALDLGVCRSCFGTKISQFDQKVGTEDDFCTICGGTGESQ